MNQKPVEEIAKEIIRKTCNHKPHKGVMICPCKPVIAYAIEAERSHYEAKIAELSQELEAVRKELFAEAELYQGKIASLEQENERLRKKIKSFKEGFEFAECVKELEQKNSTLTHALDLADGALESAKNTLDYSQGGCQCDHEESCRYCGAAQDEIARIEDALAKIKQATHADRE